VPVYQRLDEVDAELEVAAQRIDTVRSSQHSVASVHAHSTVLPIATQTFGEIELGIVCDGSRVYLIDKSPCFQQLLKPRELRDGE
jgi:hypothetical protein